MDEQRENMQNGMIENETTGEQKPDGDGWMYVRAKDGTEGFLPVTQM